MQKSKVTSTDWELVNEGGRKFLVIKPFGEGFEYSIPFNELQGKELVDWKKHLKRKKWINDEIYINFIQAVKSLS